MKTTYLIIGFLFVNVSFYGQEILTKEKAVEVTLENNYDIRVTKNNLETAKNNKSIYNSAYLPTIVGNAGVTYSKNDTDNEFQDGTVNSVTGAESKAYNASLGLNYTIFNGFNRQNTFKRLKESYNLTELQARETIENTYLQLFTTYFQIARFSENTNNLQEALTISKQRLTRAKYQYDYGQSTKLEFLNAQVDVNNDSLEACLLYTSPSPRD